MYRQIAPVPDSTARIRDHRPFHPATEDWQNFYGLVEQRIANFWEQHAENDVALAIMDMQQTEVDLWKKHGTAMAACFISAERFELGFSS
ncbi:MAG: hypothetical protein KDA76_03175 [Planctomycetaceae bacterium]|nr:hypothetical protein [Planctomycetaceae bacterium]